MKQLLVNVIAAVCLSVMASGARANEATIAVAANFTEVMQHLKTDFEATTGDRLRVTIGSTGSLYAQIQNGAPFDVMLAADERRPRLLVENGGAVQGTRFTYAIGRLTLWSPDPKMIGTDGAKTLAAARFGKLAMANPKLAPYGAAAQQTLDSLGLAKKLASHIVMGANIGQTFAMVSTGNADLGFVALSYVLSNRNQQQGSRWDVPSKDYMPIRQDAVLTMHGRDNPVARTFLKFLRSPQAVSIIKRYGYLTVTGK